MSETAQLGIGDQVTIAGIKYTVETTEETKTTRRAVKDSTHFELELRRRPLNRYMSVSIEEHKRGDIIREEFTCLRIRSKADFWNVYLDYKVRKEEL